MQDQATLEPVGTEPLSEATVPPARSGLPGWLRQVVSVLLAVLGVALLWEAYKALGQATDLPLPVRTDDSAMPHVWDILEALFRPAQRGGRDVLLVILARAALFTWREALVGFVTGSLVGFGLGVAFVRSSLLERGLMPYVVISQTVPLLAIAPMVVIWGSRLDWPRWWSVSIIAAYLTFFPVTINTLRGLRSPAPTALELMRSYAAPARDTLWKVRLPAALPYIFTALKISASASIVGAIIGELPAGMGDGLGRALLNFSYYYISGPERLFATIIVSSLLGIAFVAAILIAERLVIGRRPAER